VTTPQPLVAAGRGAGPALAALRAMATGMRRHWPLALVLAAGAALRYVALQAVYPGIWFPDSNKGMARVSSANVRAPTASQVY